MSQRTASVGKSEHTRDHTSGSHMFLEIWFEQSYVVKGEPTEPLLADSQLDFCQGALL